MLFWKSLEIQDNQDNAEPHNERHIPQNHLRRKHIAKTINSKEIAVVTDSGWQWKAEKQTHKMLLFRVGILRINPILILEKVICDMQKQHQQQPTTTTLYFKAN